MKIVWKSECYVCEAPLNPRIKTRDRENKEFIREYRHIRPLFTYNNESYYSFVNGPTLKRVCYSCLVNKPKPHISSLRERELGSRRRVLPKSKSKTRDEILLWYDGMVRQAVKRGLDIKK